MPVAELDGFELVYSMAATDPRAIDDNAHLNIACYAIVLAEAATVWHPNFGMPADDQERHGGTFFVSECRVKYFREALLGKRIDL
jgi:acyl-CoA thioesterase FadM